MNAQMQVLQALDAAQAAFKQMPGMPAEERAQTARVTLHQVISAPWSLVTRPEEADQHGWLPQMEEALQRIQQDPDGEAVDRLVEEGLWAANELERDMRRLVGAR